LQNSGRINTGGIYTIEILYHAIDANGNGDKTDDGLGVMFATINGVEQGFYTTWVSGQPQYYPVGLSFKGDMEHMQVFAGSWAGDPSGWNYGKVYLSDVEVTGYAGTSDPLVADFTYSPDPVFTGDIVQFTDTSHGGMDPYSYAWDFDNNGVIDSTLQNPTHTFTVPGTYSVKLTVNPFRCVPKTVTKTLTVSCPAYLEVIKFYDANANGKNDDGMEIDGWPVEIDGTIYYTPVNLKLAPGTYTVSESLSGTWLNTTPESVDVDLACDDEETVSFGNLCLGPGGGMTPGYWSNKNGEKTFTNVIGTEPALEALVDRNLWKCNKKTGKATEFDPATYKQVKDWLLARDAVDMRYQLSASLAAMQLNVLAGFVDEDAVVYAGPELEFMSIEDLMNAANLALGKEGLKKGYLEQFYHALDNANNNYNFVQPKPCEF